MTVSVYNDNMNKKQRHKLTLKNHYKYIESLGVGIDTDTGEINGTFEGYDLPDYKVRQTVPTSDRITGDTKKRLYSTQLPVGKTISVAYNKGPYMVVDQKDFNTMGKKI